MQCLNEAIALFEGSTKIECPTCAAIAIAVVSFVLGLLVMCLVCKLFCHGACRGAKKANGGAPRKPAAKGEEKPFEKRKPHPAPADGSVEIYVGNLSYEMTEEQLRKEFEAFGRVNSARLITNRYNGKSKGYGFVQMPNRPEAEAAVAALNDKEVLGRKMKCNEAKNLI